TTDPSPTDDATRLTDPERTSPTAKIPGCVVSYGLATPASGPVLTKPLSSSSTRPESHAVLGAAPTMMNKAPASIRTFPFGSAQITASSRSSPSSADNWDP